MCVLYPLRRCDRQPLEHNHGAVDLPFFIYNIPQLTGYNLSRGLFERMLQNEKIAGIKNSNEVAHQIMQFKALGGENFIVLNGPDEQYLAGRLMGADAESAAPTARCPNFT